MTGRALSLRILHLRNSDRFGGPERLILDQALLASPGVRVILVSFGRAETPHPFLDRARAEGAEVCRLPQANSYDPRIADRLRSILHRWRPDVVVSHDYKADLLLALAARDRPRVAVVHGYTAENTKIRLFESLDRLLLRGFDSVVVVSDALRLELERRGVSPVRIHVVSNGVEADRVAAASRDGRTRLRADWELGERDIALLVLGRLSPEKGQDVALEAFHGLSHPAARLVLVGDGATREALEATAHRLGIAERVRFPGWRDDPWACLGAADVFLLPSRREGLPLALLEAMAAERPVVATDVGAVSEALAGGAAGLVVPPDDAPRLREAIADVLASPDPAAARCQVAARRVRESYGVDSQVRRLEAIYGAAQG